MNLFYLLEILGGLALFIYGINEVSSDLKTAFGKVIKVYLDKISANKFYAFLFGMVLSVATQSSTVATAFVVGLINVGILEFPRSIEIMIGASVGTTISIIIFTFPIKNYALGFIFVGLFGLKLYKDERVKSFFKVILSFGFLFLGMWFMSYGASSLKSDPKVTELITAMVRHPLLLGVSSFAFAVIFQSSAATMATAISLVEAGVLKIIDILPIIFGAHVGSSSTVVIAGFDMKTEAKRLAWACFIYKIVGVLVFIPFYRPSVLNYVNLLPLLDVQKVVVLHFMVASLNAIVFLPFTGVFSSVMYKLIPPDIKEDISKPKYLDRDVLGIYIVAIRLVQKELTRVASFIESAFRYLEEYLRSQDKDALKNVVILSSVSVDLIEECLDYVYHIEAKEGIQHQVSMVQICELLKDVANVIRKDICGVIIKDIPDEWMKEILKVYQLVGRILKLSLGAYALGDVNMFYKAVKLKEELDELIRIYRREHLVFKRDVDLFVRQKYWDLIISFKKIADYAVDIAELSVECD